MLPDYSSRQFGQANDTLQSMGIGLYYNVTIYTILRDKTGKYIFQSIVQYQIYPFG